MMVIYRIRKWSSSEKGTKLILRGRDAEQEMLCLKINLVLDKKGMYGQFFKISLVYQLSSPPTVFVFLSES